MIMPMLYAQVKKFFVTKRFWTVRDSKPDTSSMLIVHFVTSKWTLQDNYHHVMFCEGGIVHKSTDSDDS